MSLHQSKKIIIIPGIFDIQYECKPLYAIAKEMGFEVIIFHYTPWGRESFFSVEEKLEFCIKKHKPVGVVGFSHGGTLAICARHDLPILSIGGTIRGTTSGYLWQTVGFRELRFGSKYLSHVQDMSSRHLKQKRGITSIYTPFDLIIIPFTSSKIGDSHMVFAPLHQLICFWPASQRIIRDFLSKLAS